MKWKRINEMKHTQLIRFMREDLGLQGYSYKVLKLVMKTSSSVIAEKIDHHLAQEIIHQDGERSLHHAYQREAFMNKVAAQFLDLYPNETIEEYYP
jgi:hypothetical protein